MDLLPAVTLGAAVAMALGLSLASKWQLGMRRSAVTLALMAIAAAAVVIALGEAISLNRAQSAALVAALTLVLAGSIVLWRFYRDPERTPPDRPGVILSPADGVVVYVHRSRAGELPVSTKHGRPYVLDELVRTPLRCQDATVVGIALSFLDVHVNRAPIEGTVTVQRRYPGPFASLKDPHAVFTNERATTVLERQGLEVAVVLIASRLVRRIVSYVQPGEAVVAGQRIGVIRFGSQVDLVMPTNDARVVVEPGQRVVAGETVVAEAALDDVPDGPVPAEPARAVQVPKR
jgi:phosphatidylserine decarboxylase